MKRFREIFPVMLFSLLAAVTVLSVSLSAEGAAPAEAENLEISVTCPGADTAPATDRNETTFVSVPAGGTVTVSAGSGISSLYIEFDRVFGEWSLLAGNVTVTCGKNGFLHEYVDVKKAFGYSPGSVTLTFSGGTATVSEIYALGEGTPPSWVQVWEPPCEDADLVLFSTHIDDEQLFFAGLLPYYSGELGYRVEVVYFTSPYTYHDRQHEQLNGLWTVGVRNYPVEGELIDSYSENAADAYSQQAYYGFSRDFIVKKQVEALRRFHPHVVVGHDVNGEYGHGQHIINSETLREALPLAADAGYDPESAKKYGVWDTPKAYIHLWEENEIVMNWDIPLEKFGGKTAFQVTQDGFMCHRSQHWTKFYGWIYGTESRITKASEITTYSPCLYGLFRSTVGADVKGGDMFENIPMSYAEIEAEAERQRVEESLAESRAESERVSLEESVLASESVSAEESRLESERVSLEESALASESVSAEESRLESERVSLEESALASESVSAEESRTESELRSEEDTRKPEATGTASGPGTDSSSGWIVPTLCIAALLVIAAVLCVLRAMPQFTSKTRQSRDK